VIRRASRRAWRSPMVSEPCRFWSSSASLLSWIYSTFWKDSGRLRTSSTPKEGLEAELWVPDRAPCESWLAKSIRLSRGFARA